MSSALDLADPAGAEEGVKAGWDPVPTGLSTPRSLDSFESLAFDFLEAVADLPSSLTPPTPTPLACGVCRAALAGCFP